MPQDMGALVPYSKGEVSWCLGVALALLLVGFWPGVSPTDKPLVRLCQVLGVTVFTAVFLARRCNP